MTKPSLTLIVLTRHYDALLQKKLGYFPGWIEEIIIVEDAPPSVMKKMGRIKIFSRPLNHNYGAQRNWALEQSASDWTLFLDDDEIPNKNFFPKLWELLNKNQASAIAVNRNQVFMGQILQYGDAGSQSIVRIAKTKLSQKRWQGSVHESWNLTDNVLKSDLCLDHQNEPSLTDFFTRLHQYAQLDAQERGSLQLSRLCTELFLFPKAKFVLNYFLKSGYRDGLAGFVHAWCMSYYSAIVRIYQYENSHR
jgi:glycosyltransferase involved in cell wall biosynthesis